MKFNDMKFSERITYGLIILHLFLVVYLISILHIDLKQLNIEANEVYVICDVVKHYDTETNTVLVCEMPNGELHEYYIVDAPEGGIDIACLRTENQDDYTMYEVVAVR